MPREVFENNPNQPLLGDEVDGMAKWIEEAEADGFEGEHVFDGSIEDPPHPYWDPVNRCFRPEID